MNRWWPAPAKLNLFLHVTGRRGDGYHELQTVFQFLERGDRLAFNPRGDGHIRRLGEVPGVAPEADLVVRAALALRARVARDDLGADVTVDKQLPLGGGLGGGSSDAATTLVALDRLWGLGLGESVLAEVGLALGADVPVFVRGAAAWAEGIGERLTPVALDEPWFAVVHPGISVSTGAIFGAPELTRDTPRSTMPRFSRGSGGASVTAILAATRNDCEPVVVARHPEVAAALAWLRSRAGLARMTGTGACVFAPFPGFREAQAAVQNLPPGWRAIVARGRNRSPLLDGPEPG